MGFGGDVQRMFAGALEHLAFALMSPWLSDTLGKHPICVRYTAPDVIIAAPHRLTDGAAADVETGQWVPATEAGTLDLLATRVHGPVLSLFEFLLGRRLTDDRFAMCG
jgi:hypothetical protein